MKLRLAARILTNTCPAPGTGSGWDIRRKELSDGAVNSMAYMVDSVWTDPQRTRIQIPDTLALTQDTGAPYAAMARRRACRRDGGPGGGGGTGLVCEGRRLTP